MPLFTYIASVDGQRRVGEVTADDETLAKEAALHLHVAEGDTVIVHRVMPAPARRAEAPRPGNDRIRLGRWDGTRYGHRRRA